MRSLHGKLIAALLAAATIAPMAHAAPWQSINQRQSNLWSRIDQGVRQGGLTRNEAQQLRSRFWTIARLETRYRRNGLSLSERRDLDRRFDALSRSIRLERRDRRTQAGPWQSINRRQSMLWSRIDQGVRQGGLTRNEAEQLRSRFWTLARLETRYRRNGLSLSERRDLDRRFDVLSRSIRMQRGDWQTRRR